MQQLVGRCIAEGKYCAAANVVTLTYGTSNRVGNAKVPTLSASVLTYSDIQKYFKRLRKAGFIFRYVVAGEYGSMKGRAHWHIIFFWQHRPDGGPVKPAHPEIPWIGGNGVKWWHDPFWTLHEDSAKGYSHWDHFTYESARYVTKYIMKAEDDPNAQCEIHWSKHPILGAKFFRKYALRHVIEELPPTKPGKSCRYSFEDVLDFKTGRPRVFIMHEAAKYYFLRKYIQYFKLYHGVHPSVRMHSEALDWYEDQCARHLESEMLSNRKYGSKPKGVPMDMETGEVFPYWFSAKLNSFVTMVGDGSYRYWSKDEWGNPSWQEYIAQSSGRTGAVTAPTTPRAESEIRHSSEQYRKASKGA